MSTKYDWSNVPEEVKWIATDLTGHKSYHLTKPRGVAGDWLDESARGAFDYFDSSEYEGHWQDSLEERPQ